VNAILPRTELQSRLKLEGVLTDLVGDLLYVRGYKGELHPDPEYFGHLIPTDVGIGTQVGVGDCLSIKNMRGPIKAALHLCHYPRSLGEIKDQVRPDMRFSESSNGTRTYVVRRVEERGPVCVDWYPGYMGASYTGGHQFIWEWTRISERGLYICH